MISSASATHTMLTLQKANKKKLEYQRINLKYKTHRPAYLSYLLFIHTKGIEVVIQKSVTIWLNPFCKSIEFHKSDA